MCEMWDGVVFLSLLRCKKSLCAVDASDIRLQLIQGLNICKTSKSAQYTKQKRGFVKKLTLVMLVAVKHDSSARLKVHNILFHEHCAQRNAPVQPVH
jgi:hypothetical protein